MSELELGELLKRLKAESAIKFLWAFGAFLITITGLYFGLKLEIRNNFDTLMATIIKTNTESNKKEDTNDARNQIRFKGIEDKLDVLEKQAPTVIGQQYTISQPAGFVNVHFYMKDGKRHYYLSRAK